MRVRTERGQVRRVIVVGAGIAGVFTALSLTAARVPVLLVSATAARRSHSGSDQAGFFAAGGTSSGLEAQLSDTLRAGGALVSEPLLRSMLEAGPGLLQELVDSGVPFERTPSGAIALGPASGTTARATAYAGARTGQRVLHALEARLRREAATPLNDEHGAPIAGESRVVLMEGWEFRSLVLDDSGAAVGVVAQDLRSMAIKALRGDAVCIATGGATKLFEASTGSESCTGSALAALARQGAVFGNPEFVEWHPFSVRGTDKCFGIGERAIADGARLWVPREPDEPRQAAELDERDRNYLLEGRVPETGNRSAWGLATRLLHSLPTAVDAAETGGRVYLDLRHQDTADAERTLEPSRANVARALGLDLLRAPIPVVAAAHYTLGGLWTDHELGSDRRVAGGSPRNHATSISGVYAVGEASFQYHGAGQLGSNVQLSHCYGAALAAGAIESYRASLVRSAFDLPGSIFERAEAREIARYEARFVRQERARDDEPRTLMQELQTAMWAAAGPRRTADGLRSLLGDVESLRARAGALVLTDRGSRSNQLVPQLRALGGMLTLARLTATCALARTESRGTHYRADHPESDPSWQRTTLARLDADEQVQFVREFSYANAGLTISVTDSVESLR